jgi:hypothetical protein
MHAATFADIEARLNTPGSTSHVVYRKERVQLTPRATEDLFRRQRAHWEKLHTQTFDAITFAEWVASIPGCATCKRDFLELIKINPPRFDDWWKWGWEIHNAVSRKLNKTEFTWAEFEEKYPQEYS